MNGAQGLAYFSLELVRASGQLGLEHPAKVRGVSVAERDPRAAANVVAYVTPDRTEVHVLWWALWKYGKKTLRCVARHEALHIALGHEAPADLARAERQHQDVDEILRIKWHEPKRCGL
jgi:hypothetical protein